MTRKSGSKPSTVAWIDINLTKEQSLAMKKLYSEEGRLADDTERLLDSGYKISLSQDKYNDCFACYIIPHDPGSVNLGKILTVRAFNMWNAIRGALYRHFVLFAGDNWTNHEQRSIDED